MYIKGTPGIGFKLNADGNFDLEQKQLKNLKSPIDSHDGATKIYVDDVCNGLITNKIVDVMKTLNSKEEQLNKQIDNNFTAIEEYVNTNFDKILKRNNAELLETLNLRMQLMEEKLQNQMFKHLKN